MTSCCPLLGSEAASWAGYGGRGITVCARWRDSFAAFLADMGGERPAGFSIERLDNERGYEPGNCVWALPWLQARNRRSTVWVTYRGRRVKLAELLEAFDMRHSDLPSRTRLTPAALELELERARGRPKIMGRWGLQPRPEPEARPYGRLSVGFRVIGRCGLLNAGQREGAHPYVAAVG